MARAAHHGLTVSKPWGDTARYDFHRPSRAASSSGCRFKSTTSCPPSYKRISRADTFAGSSRTRHRPKTALASTVATEIDFFAFYIVPEDLWYIVSLRGDAPLPLYRLSQSL